MDSADDSLASHELEEAQNAFATHDGGGHSFEKENMYDEADDQDRDISQGSLTRSESLSETFSVIKEMILGNILAEAGELNSVS